MNIDTSMSSEEKKASTDGRKVGKSESANTPSNTTISPASGGGTAQDTHPYARGSVIEVNHYEHTGESSTANGGDGDDWWSESETESEDGNKEGDDEAAAAQQHHHIHHGRKKTIRLCDIIDRTQQADGSWHYYVHYKDFNRRMDEWVAIDRIVSPPSIGNAKARALKREEERIKRKQQRKQEEEKAATAAAALDWTAPRSRRRASAVDPAMLQQQDGSTTVNADGTTTEAGDATAAAPRRTRMSRRKTANAQQDDDATVMASNATADDGTGGDNDKDNSGDAASSNMMMSSMTTKKEIVISTDAVTTHTVGEHVVATIKAQELDEHEGLDEASLREHEEVTKVKNVSFVEIGQYQMETWYYSPLPKELLTASGLIEVLYVCEFSFNLFARKSELRRSQARLPVNMRHPPGNEIYRNGNLSMFEVDGFEEKIYCQNLCYIAKLFLDHKTLYFDVDPFLFYVLCEVDDRGFHPVGYYSKEKYSDVGYNLACILTFPCHQRKGYGRFLIAFSYELSKKEEKVGSPEKPMSDLGQQAYKPYWTSTIVDFLLNQSDESSLSIMDIAKKTSIMAEDIVFTLNQLGLLKMMNEVYFVVAEKSLLERLAQKYPIKEPRVDPSKLHWTPFLTDVKRDKFSIHNKKPSLLATDTRGASTAGAAK